jgi:hypothetical protein
MTEDRQLDLALRVLDQQVVDHSGLRCGKVDDVELDGKLGETARPKALLIGPSAWAARLPAALRILPTVTRGFGDKPLVRIAWSDIDEITHVIKLKKDADELGLGVGDSRVGRWLSRIPGS